MPTSVEEARAITQIINEFLSPEQAQEITRRLDNEVGTKTENESLKISLQMLKALYEQTENSYSTRVLKGLLALVISFHASILLVNLVAIFCLPFVTPWYVAVPIISLLVNLMFTPVVCPLTRLESMIRRALGMPEVRHFIGHYLIWPVRKRLRNGEN